MSHLTPSFQEDWSAAALQLLKLLADETRWQLIAELRLSDRQVGELVTRLGLPQNLISYHLGLLRQAGLVQVRRSDVDGRAIYYGIDIAVLQAAHRQIGTSLQLPDAAPSVQLPALPVVFLCTANSARSQMAEGWLRHLSNGQVPVQSAGTHPAPLHPLAVQVMAEAGIDISTQQAKDVQTLAGLHPGVAVTVCDRAREECQPCLDAPVQLHWSIANPARAQAAPAVQLETFRATRDQLRERVTALVALLPTIPAS